MSEENTMSDKPLGFRDVYWCYLLNEPVIISYDGGKAYCRNCNMHSDAVAPDEIFLNHHRFITSIIKPTEAKVVSGLEAEVRALPEVPMSDDDGIFIGYERARTDFLKLLENRRPTVADVKGMLASSGIEVEEGDLEDYKTPADAPWFKDAHSRLTVKDAHGNVTGYACFETDFYFDSDGKLVGMGLWE